MLIYCDMSLLGLIVRNLIALYQCYFQELRAGGGTAPYNPRSTTCLP